MGRVAAQAASAGGVDTEKVFRGNNEIMMIIIIMIMIIIMIVMIIHIENL